MTYETYHDQYADQIEKHERLQEARAVAGPEVPADE